MNLLRALNEKYKKIPITLKAGAWFAFSIVIVKAMNFLTMPIFTRMLTVDEYGSLNLFLTIESVLLIFTSLYLFYSVFVSGMHKYEGDDFHFINSLQIITSVSTLLFFLLYLSIHSLIDKFIGLPFELMVVMFVDLFFTPAYQFWMARERYKYRYRAVVIVTVLLCLLTFGANLLSVYLFENRLYAKILSTVVVNVCFCAFFYIYFFVKGKPTKNERLKEYVKYALRFNIPLIPHFLSAFVLNLSDRLMINYITGSYDAGLYSVAYSISSIMIFINTAINQVVPPWFYKKMDAGDYKTINRVCGITLSFIGFINFLLILIAPELIRIFSTEEYLESIWVIPPVAASSFFIFFIDYIANAEYYFDETKNTKWISLVPAVLNVVLNFVFISNFGYIAAGYTTFISYAVFAIIRFFYMSRIVKKHGVSATFINWKMLGLISLLFISLCATSLITYNYTIVRYALFGVLLIALLLVAIFNRNKLVKLVRG